MTSKQIRKATELVVTEQRCKHALTGLAPRTKMCANNYECGTCPFDQMLEDMAPAYEALSEARRVTPKAA